MRARVAQLKQVLMAVYFGADHVVWASQAGLYTNKQAVERCAACAPPQGLGSRFVFRFGRPWSRARQAPLLRATM